MCLSRHHLTCVHFEQLEVASQLMLDLCRAQPECAFGFADPTYVNVKLTSGQLSHSSSLSLPSSSTLQCCDHAIHLTEFAAQHCRLVKLLSLRFGTSSSGILRLQLR